MWGVGYFWLLPQAEEALEGVAEEIEKGIDEMVEAEEFAQNWSGPSEDVADDVLFPPQAAGATRESVDDQAAVKMFGVDLEGRHAVYKAAEGHTVEISAYRATAAESQDVFEQINKAIDEGGFKFQTNVNIGHRMYFDVSGPAVHGYLWSGGDWLFFFRTSVEVELDEFADAYLRAIEVGGSAEAGAASEAVDAATSEGSEGEADSP